MSRIFDNIDQQLLSAIQDALQTSNKADFCVGYFNLRGWKSIDSYIDSWAGGEDNCCRLLIGMTRLPDDELRDAFRLLRSDSTLDNAIANEIKKQIAKSFATQLITGAPTNQDEAGLRALLKQIKSKRLLVKLFMAYLLHAKLYLTHRTDPHIPTIGFLGSSNLTMAGLARQGELNIDVMDYDDCQKLTRWFEDRWNDRWCIDFTADLIDVIENSWAREDLIPPYHIYVKMAYHLSQEARLGLTEFTIPKDFGNRLFDYQKAAVKIAAHHLNKRGGVLIGDVVGLGKTLMATALARIFEDDFGLETLIICPANLVKMWEDYKDTYRLRARVMSIGQVEKLSELRRYRLVIIDESHNLRNRDGVRYRVIHDYVHSNESMCIMLTATPYNKSYVDLSNQLRLFVPDEADIGIRPEILLKEIGETEFIRRHQCSVRSLAAFEKSEYPDDWRELMRLYMVRRTRTFIKDNYAETDEDTGRKYLLFENKEKAFFPDRVPKTVKFNIDEKNPSDQYARLYDPQVVDLINDLNLPRYGLGNYIKASPHEPPKPNEAKQLQDLSRAGKRLMGFCRTNLFKRLESSGFAFLQSIERHILRNYVFLYAIESGKPLPIGTQDPAYLSTVATDEDESLSADMELFDTEATEGAVSEDEDLPIDSDDLEAQATGIYSEYESRYKKRFKWLRPDLFIDDLAADLKADIKILENILDIAGDWQPQDDAKLVELFKLISDTYATDKVLVFTQYADTVHYLEDELKKQGVTEIAGATGNSSDPTLLAWRFSPISNEKSEKIKKDEELRVLIATDVLSEGQNLQDCSIVVNYDLPWAIIRLIQRAGRVDRLGQRAESILCYSFLPADGVEKIIKLRSRVRQRLKENAEVVGTDEAFFEDDDNNQAIIDLYNEKAGILDGDSEGEVDLASYAFQIWQEAIKNDPSLEKKISQMPSVVYSSKKHDEESKYPEGVLVYMKTADSYDALVWVDKNGSNVTESQYEILRAAQCEVSEPALPRMEEHHALVGKAVEQIIREESCVGGQLGRPSGARFRTYERLHRYLQEISGTLFDSEALRKAVQDIYTYPLRQVATDTLNRQLRSGIDDQALSDLVVGLRDENRLSIIDEKERTDEAQIICSMGLID